MYITAEEACKLKCWFCNYVPLPTLMVNGLLAQLL